MTDLYIEPWFYTVNFTLHSVEGMVEVHYTVVRILQCPVILYCRSVGSDYPLSINSGV